MIDHSNCDHPSTSSARAKCRRARASGKESTSNGEKREGATPKTVFFGKAHHDPNRERNRGTTPRDKFNQCHICGIEKIEFSGTDPVSGILLFVGERCTYRIENEPDFKAVP
jgi:hypothetical protein